MVDGRDWDALVRRFLFYLVRAEGFPGVCVGFLGSFFLGCRFFLFFSLFVSFAGLLNFFFYLFWGLRDSEPWGWLWTWFLWLNSHWDFRYTMIWRTIFFHVFYGLGDGAT